MGSTLSLYDRVMKLMDLAQEIHTSAFENYDDTAWPFYGKARPIITPLTKFVESRGYRYVTGPECPPEDEELAPDGVRGGLSWEHGYMWVRSTQPVAIRQKVCLHECGHLVLHEKLAFEIPLMDCDEAWDTSIKLEFDAEAVALLAAHRLNLPYPIEYAVDYIKGWQEELRQPIDIRDYYRANGPKIGRAVNIICNAIGV